MRTFTLLFICIFTFNFAIVAQPSAGTIIAGGSFGMSFQSSKTVSNETTNEGPRVNQFNINPRAGLFLQENILLGAGIGYNVSQRKTSSGNNEVINSSSEFSIQPFARYYLDNRIAWFFFEAGANMGFGGSRTKSGGVTVDGPSTRSLGFGISPGVYYYITENFHIEAKFGNFGFTNQTVTQTNGNKQHNNNFALSMFPNTISFGLFYNIR